jgi:hypothetical protein
LSCGDLFLARSQLQLMCRADQVVFLSYSKKRMAAGAAEPALALQTLLVVYRVKA